MTREYFRSHPPRVLQNNKDLSPSSINDQGSPFVTDTRGLVLRFSGRRGFCCCCSIHPFRLPLYLRGNLESTITGVRTFVSEEYGSLG
jgi:hypothetical protein